MVNVAVLGGGNGALTHAGDLALAGHKVNLCELPRFKSNLDPVIENGGIEMKGVARNGLAKMNLVTTNMAEALHGAKVVLVVVPAYGHISFAEAIAPHIEDGQMVVLNPGYSLGSIEFSNVLAKKGVDLNKIMVGATGILTYATRKYLGWKIFVGGTKAKVPFSAFPSKNTQKMLSVLNQMYPQPDGQRGILIDSVNELKLSLENINLYVHPQMMILKAVDCEIGEEPYLKSQSSMAVKLLRKKMNEEAMGITSAFGMEPWCQEYVHDVLMYPYWLKRPMEGEKPEWAKSENQPEEYRAGAGFNFLKGRYVTEDLPYGLVPISELGKLVKVPTAAIDSVVQIGSVISETNYWETGRTFKKLGLDGMNKTQLMEYVTKGKS
jgi:opine dehydrogenase